MYLEDAAWKGMSCAWKRAGDNASDGGHRLAGSAF